MSQILYKKKLNPPLVMAKNSNCLVPLISYTLEKTLAIIHTAR